MHPSITHSLMLRREMGRNEQVEIRIKLENVPVGASVPQMMQMLETSDLMASLLIDHARQKLELALNIQKPAPAATPVTETALDFGLTPDIQSVVATSIAQAVVIPEHVKSDRDRCAYAHHYEGNELSDEDWQTPITKDGGESSGGQCKALNTLLGDKGFAADRHAACMHLLLHLTGRREWLRSVSDLTKAEAHLLIDWLSLAPRPSIDALAVEVASYDPFERDQDKFSNPNHLTGIAK